MESKLKECGQGKFKPWSVAIKAIQSDLVTRAKDDKFEGWTPVLEDYEPICLLGGGSFGAVLKARGRKTSEVVAIKKYEMKDISDETLLKTLREIQILRRLSSLENGRFVAKIQDAVVSEDI